MKKEHLQLWILIIMFSVPTTWEEASGTIKIPLSIWFRYVLNQKMQHIWQFLFGSHVEGHVKTRQVKSTKD